ncbi:ParB/RepB/Spo0J family partition protein [Algirhabdus cladophorae]|uniref:ParB/RepB/Spo0J family partition protein n=1 Tax=Algirhabdus cladophorae TaxID=3377108 RepID=UPI003B8479A0
MSKRRVFDIDFEDTDPSVPAGTEGSGRRGPMAAAISESADAVSERDALADQIRAENDALAHEHVRLKKLGLITGLIPLDQIHVTKLVRDRAEGIDLELEELKTSIQETGLSNPIRVQETADGFELIQGFRRLQAFKQLRDEGGAGFDTIPAGLVAKGENLESLYRRMVDENLVRKDISFGEMAQLAWAYVRDGNLPVQDINDAIDQLFASAARQKRAYIKNFARLFRWLDDAVQHPAALPRAVGVELNKRLEEQPEQRAFLRDKLQSMGQVTADEELAYLRSFLKASAKPSKGAKTERVKSAKTSFQMAVPAGTAKCVAAKGRVELSLNRDFSAVDRQKLEGAVEAFFKALDR